VSAAAEAGVDVAFEVLAEVDSTQTRLLSVPPAANGPWQVCVAHHQSKGRGRLDRSWESQPGDGLMFSVALRPQTIALSPIAAGVAVARAAARYLPAVRLKWPNDLVMVGREGLEKLGGIVAMVHPDDQTLVVVGIGINFGFSGERPTAQAAALSDYLDELPSREELLIAILSELAIATAMDEESLLAAYRPLCITLGTFVRVTAVSGVESVGVATGVDANGLTVTREDGVEQVFSSGDVQHLRNS